VFQRSAASDIRRARSNGGLAEGGADLPQNGVDNTLFACGLHVVWPQAGVEDG
jgi:hypothetical protein